MRLARNPARIEAWDRRRAAVHEAGHAVVGRYFGVEMQPSIWKAHDVDDPRADKTWLGRVFHPKGALPPEHAFEVGVAGVLAELHYADDDPDLDDPDECREMLDGMSPTDRELAGFDPSEDDFSNATVCRLERAYGLVCDLWPEIWRTSRGLIQQHRETSDMMRAIMAEADSRSLELES